MKPIHGFAIVALLAFALYAFRFEAGTIHYAMVGIWTIGILFYTTRKYVMALFPVIVVVFFYDSLRYFAVDSISRLQTEGVIGVERFLFGFLEDGNPNRWVLKFSHPALDFLCGLVYANHATVIIIMGIALIIRLDQDDLRVDRYFWGFFLINLIANSIQILFPVAPPWYVDLYGLAAPDMVPLSSAADLVKFDALVGVEYFANMYSQATYPFGAVPSLHIAFPTYVCFWTRQSGTRVSAIIFTVLTAFFTVYSQHHYVVDVIAGIAIAVFAVFVMNTDFIKTKLVWFRRTFVGKSPIKAHR